MVSSAFIRFSPSGGENSDHVASHRADDEKQPTFHHPDNDEALSAVILPTVSKLKGEWVVENTPRAFETNSVLGEVGGSLLIVLLECSIIHYTYTAKP
jgi:hypothetical protein